MRQHFVKWTCDRCGISAEVASKSDQRVPPGFSDATGGLFDLCAACHAQWAADYPAFLSKFLGKDLPLPEPEEPTGQSTEDVLLEMDPEVEED